MSADPYHDTDQPPAIPDPIGEGVPIIFTYTNWRGETAQRAAIPKSLWYGHTDWHREDGWMLTAFDVEKQAVRDFALKDCDFAGRATTPSEDYARGVRDAAEAVRKAADEDNSVDEAIARYAIIGLLADAQATAVQGKEGTCDQCGCEYPVWFAPNHLWNLAMGGPDAIDDPTGMLCPTCFMKRAEAAGAVATAWEVRPERAMEHVRGARERHVRALDVTGLPVYRSPLVDKPTILLPPEGYDRLAEMLGAEAVLEPHQQRVLAERAALAEKCVKLEAFLGSPAFRALDVLERDLLSDQHDAMTGYLAILDRRIERFTSSPSAPEVT